MTDPHDTDPDDTDPHDTGPGGPDARIFRLRDFAETEQILDRLGRGVATAGDRLDPALAGLLSLRADVDSRHARLLSPASPSRQVDPRRNTATRWSRLVPAAACAVLAVCIALGAGAEHTGQAVPATPAAPVMTLLAAAEADLASALASSPDAQPALLEHSRLLVDQARQAVAALPATSRATAAHEVDAVDARVAGVDSAKIAEPGSGVTGAVPPGPEIDRSGRVGGPDTGSGGGPASPGSSAAAPSGSVAPPGPGTASPGGRAVDPAATPERGHSPVRSPVQRPGTEPGAKLRGQQDRPHAGPQDGPGEPRQQR